MGDDGPRTTDHGPQTTSDGAVLGRSGLVLRHRPTIVHRPWSVVRPMRFIDTHCHLNHGDFAADLEPAIERAVDAGVEAMLVIGYDMASSERAVELAEADARLWAAVGMHPYEAEAVTPAVLERLRQLTVHPRVAAIGEIG